MAELTDADKKAFIDKIIGTLKDPTTKARLVAKDWDPTQRTTNLANGVTSVTNDEGIISNLEATLSAAVSTRRTDLDNTYDLASASLSSIEGALGKDDQLVKDCASSAARSTTTPPPRNPPPPAASNGIENPSLKGPPEPVQGPPERVAGPPKRVGGAEQPPVILSAAQRSRRTSRILRP